MRVVSTAMERAVGESALRLEAQMILLATAVSGAPFLGLLGTVWGVMDTFTGVALAGSASLRRWRRGSPARHHCSNRTPGRYPRDVWLQFSDYEYTLVDRPERQFRS